MDLDQQIQVLKENSDQDGGSPQLVSAIAPVLKRIAQELRHSEYYILQTLDQSLLLTTLTHRTKPELTKNVIYAFGTVEDAAVFSSQDSQAISLRVPVIHILFQLLALDMVDSLVFFDTPGYLTTGTEVKRQDLLESFEAHLKQVMPSQYNIKSPPPDIA